MSVPDHDRLDPEDPHRPWIQSDDDAFTGFPIATDPGTGYKLWTADDIENRPSPEALIDDILVKGTLSALFGNPGSYKSFIAMGMGQSVAHGTPWGAIHIVGEGWGERRRWNVRQGWSAVGRPLWTNFGRGGGRRRAARRAAARSRRSARW